MIAEIRFQNLYSFRDETVLSFEADSSTDLEQVHTVEVAPGVRLLKLAVIYGANASGKSNVLRAWEFFQEFIKRARLNKNETLPYTPFMLNNSSRTGIVKFTLTFYVKVDEKYEKYLYDLQIFGNTITKESLLHYQSVQPTRIFDRGMVDGASTVTFNKKMKVPALIRKELEIKLLPNISVFSAYRQINTVLEDLEIPTKYIEEKISFPVVGMDEYFPEQFDLNDESLKNSIIGFLNEADFNITDVEQQEQSLREFHKFNNFLLSRQIKNLNDFTLNDNNNSSKDSFIFDSGLRFVHSVKSGAGIENYTFDDKMESAGTLRIFRLAGYIYRVLKEGGFIAIDEIESSLHPKLVEFVIERFLKMSKDQQMLFTTHYDGLLAEEDLIRKDNIWFTAKNEEGASELYALTDFTGLNRISSLQRAYKIGKFGAIPNI